jgi:hypothetical protein
VKTRRTIETWSCDAPGCTAKFEWPGAPVPPSGWASVSYEGWEADAEWNPVVHYRHKVFCEEHARAVRELVK